jgi:ssDNA-binding Zn-finger/Zn-ribbon topoisomerase 1
MAVDLKWGRRPGSQDTGARKYEALAKGRPVDGHESKYLLTGLSRCSSCGGTMIVRSRRHGRRRAFFYACSSLHHRGKTVCANSLEMPLQAAADSDRGKDSRCPREQLRLALFAFD